MTEVNKLKGSSSPQKDPEKVLEEISSNEEIPGLKKKIKD